MSKKVFNKRPIVYYCLALLIGIYFALIVDKIIYIAIACLIISVAFIFFRKKRILAIILICFNLGALSYGINVTGFISANTTIGEGIIIGRVIKLDGVNFIIDGVSFGGERQKANALCENISQNNISVGDTVKIIGRISPKKLDITNGKDVNYFLDKAIYSVTIYELEITGNKPSPKDFIKNKISNIYKKIFSEETFGFAFSFLSGDKLYLEYDTKTSLNHIGLSHILAISGMHIGFILSILYFVGNKLKINKKLSYVLIAIILLIYLYFTGFSPSTLRTAMLFFIMITAELLFKRNDNLSSLCLSIFIICLFSPIMLFSISFIMSALAVLGIFMFYRVIYEKFKNKNAIINKFVISSVSLSVSANSFLLLILLGEFHQLNLIFVFANLLMLPIVSLWFTLQFIFTVVALILPFMDFLLYACDVLAKIILLVAKTLSINNLFVIEIGGLSLLFSAVYSGSLIVASPYCLADRNTKQKILIIGFISLFLLLLIGLF